MQSTTCNKPTTVDARGPTVVTPLYRILINEISINHEARTPEGLARNVVLIRELNSNVAKVASFPVGLYLSLHHAKNHPMPVV